MPAKDPTAPLRKMAASFPEVIEGASCNQTSYKIGKKAFLYIGEQGGRYKAMFKLADSAPRAEELAAASPEDFQVGQGGWVTARFSSDTPLPKKLWEAWLNESHGLSVGTKKKAAGRKTASKKATKKR